MRRVMVNSIGFILGFSVVFITLGAISTEIGQIAARYKHTLSIVAGVVIIIFGLHLTGIFKIKALYTDARLHSVKGQQYADWRICDRIRLCLRLDSVPGADLDRDPNAGRRAEYGSKRNFLAGGLLTGTRSTVLVDIPADGAFSEIL